MNPDAFATHIEAVARILLGEPNRRLSTAKELRYGTHGSLAIDCGRGIWFDHEAQKGGGVLDLIRDRTGLANGEAIEWMREQRLLPAKSVISLNEQRPAFKGITATYDYCDESGKLLFQVVRFTPKAFSQRRPDPSAPGRWVWDRHGVPPVPYRLPELSAATTDEVFITEGEKDADSVAKLGFVATTNPGGAGNWTADLNSWFRERIVNILMDNDEAGVSHGRTVAENLKWIAREVRLVQLPGLGPKEDVSNWLEKGGDAQQLTALCAVSPRYGHEPIGFTAAQLKPMYFPPIKYVVPNYIVEGLTLFAGKPKRGKSWACMDIAIAVATGGTALGGVACERGDVCYAALEDNPRRLKRRLHTLIGTAEDWPAGLTFICSMPRLRDGGIALVRRWIEAAEQPRLVIVDTLAKVRDPKGEQQSNYEADYAAMSELNDLAEKVGLAIVVVSHTRKMDADDPIDTVLGTTGLTGAVDSVLVLASTSQGTTLYGRGRDLEEFEKAAHFDPVTCRWTIAGDVSEVRRTDERRAILEALRNAAEPLSPAAISAATGMRGLNVRQLLLKMVKAGEVIKCGHGRYWCPAKGNCGHV
ncbi:AAA family ATPase [Methylobacterium nigriterrae]|uniref:AAA family ATPase n=1 Tax=Methylobacterium nigriterrae TaxID=3127512 RepID=UPI0030132AD7